jgi:hypothetical protein
VLQIGKKSFSFLLLMGAVTFLGLIYRVPQLPELRGDEILTKYSEKYVVLGQKVVDKEVGGLIGTNKVPALFIYLLQDRSDPHQLLLSVSQSLGYSIDKITIDGSAVSAPITITGAGRFWSGYLSPESERPKVKLYEKEVVVSKPEDGEVHVTVTYFWIYRGAGVGAYEFETRSDTTNAVFALGSH